MSVSNISSSLAAVNTDRAFAARRASHLQTRAATPHIARPAADSSPSTPQLATSVQTESPAKASHAEHIQLTPVGNALRAQLNPITSERPRHHRLHEAAIAHLNEATAPVKQPDSNDTVSPDLTFEGLMAAWGQTDSPYDLNGDGIVDISDLMAFLAANPTTPVEENTPSQPNLTVEGLLAVWGTDDPIYDLNGDGVVDTSDLVALLAQLENPSHGSDAPATLSVGKLMEAWGTADTTYDLNGDGTVDISDLLMLLQNNNYQDISAPAHQQVINKLLEAWNSGNFEFDLNGDGSIDVSDLLKLLDELNSNKP